MALEIVEAKNTDWTDEEREKLLRYETQGQLFSDTEIKKIKKTLRKIPFDFYYRYACDTPDGEKSFKHKIVDWEAGALFWTCRESHGAGWEKPFRAKLVDELVSRDLMFLMGNQHRFQDQWLIISLIYPLEPISIGPTEPGGRGARPGKARRGSGSVDPVTEEQRSRTGWIGRPATETLLR